MGLPVQPFWWDQPKDLDLAREEGQSPPPPQQGRGLVADFDDEDNELDGLY
jgi:hypothetical protein